MVGHGPNFIAMTTFFEWPTMMSFLRRIFRISLWIMYRMCIIYKYDCMFSWCFPLVPSRALIHRNEGMNLQSEHVASKDDLKGKTHTYSQTKHHSLPIRMSENRGMCGCMSRIFTHFVVKNRWISLLGSSLLFHNKKWWFSGHLAPTLRKCYEYI